MTVRKAWASMARVWLPASWSCRVCVARVGERATGCHGGRGGGRCEPVAGVGGDDFAAEGRAMLENHISTTSSLLQSTPPLSVRANETWRSTSWPVLIDTFLLARDAPVMLAVTR